MSNEVVLITAYNGKGELLVGKRNDNGLYTLSGGHLEPGESPEVGALRELYEETGLHAGSLSFLKDYTTSDGTRLHCFSAYVSGEPHGNGDPDKEVDKWEFVDVKEGLPPKVYNHLHGPTPESGENIVTQLFDLKKAEESLEKREPGMFSSNDWGAQKISIPSMSHPGRAAYDKGYESAIRQRYGNKLKRIKVPTTSVEPTNEVHNKDRYNLYRTMARKDRLPPIVVKRTSTGFKALDGSHKYHAAIAEGVPEMDAFEVRKSEEDAKISTDPQTAKLFTGQTCPHGLKIFLVNGEHIRNHVDSDFVQGGNPERYNWIPQGEIWIDSDTPEAEIPYVSLHECDEANLMHGKGEGYEEAHDEAKRVEDKYRHQNEPGEFGKAEDADSYVTYEFPNESEADDFSHKSRNRFEDDWKGIGITHQSGWKVVVRAWDERNQKKFAELAKEHKGKPVDDKSLNHFVSPEYRRSLNKAEDEVGRMLEHPNPAERTLALKLNSVTPRHLQIASLDPDPAIHQAAIDHPQFGAAQGMHLMEATADKDGNRPTAQQLAFLSRPGCESYHLSALMLGAQTAEPQTFDQISNAVATHPQAPEGLLRSMYNNTLTQHATRMSILGHQNTPEDVLESALNTGATVPSPEAREMANKAVEHPRMSPESITALARDGLARGGHLQEIAEHGLETHATHPDLYTTLFQQALLKPSSGAAKMLGALLSGPSGTPEHAEEIAAKLHPSALADALRGPHVKPQHLDRAVAWAHSNVDHDAMTKLMDSKAFGPRHLETLLQKMEPLEKAVKPEHFKGIARASDPAGAKMVDHTPDLMAHPPGHGAEVEAYHNNVLKHPKPIGPKKTYESDLNQGVSRKKVFYAAVAGQKEPGKFMVKPYHERVIRRAKAWQKFPIQGWAEMTNQALYHAGEIGHLHQKVHVAEHDMGPGHEKEPALVVSLKPGQREQHISDSLLGNPHEEGAPEHHLDARKIAIMDMLSNNLDRHGGNLLQGEIENPDRLGTLGGNSLLAVDHSRSFQYLQPNVLNAKLEAAPKHGELTDTFARYHTHSSINQASPFLPEENLPENATPGQYTNSHYDRHMKALDSYHPAFDWWGKVGQNVRSTFHKRLDQIKDPQVRAHLKRNFDARADWLDERANIGIKNYGVTDWHKSDIPMYRPGELSEEEKERLR